LLYGLPLDIIAQYAGLSASGSDHAGVDTNLFALATPDLICPSALNAVYEPPSDGLLISRDTTYNTVPLAGTTAILMLLPEMTPLLVAH
jgi:hypothetical protein